MFNRSLIVRSGMVKPLQSKKLTLIERLARFFKFRPRYCGTDSGASGTDSGAFGTDSGASGPPSSGHSVPTSGNPAPTSEHSAPIPEHSATTPEHPAPTPERPELPPFALGLQPLAREGDDDSATHATDLIRWLRLKGLTRGILHYQILREYNTMCSFYDWEPRAWNSVARELTRQTTGKKVFDRFTLRDGSKRRLRIYPIDTRH